MGRFSCVAYRLAQDPDGNVDAVVEINNDVVRPQLAFDVFAGHQLPRAFDQHSQDLERLLAQQNRKLTVCRRDGAQFSRRQVELERSEAGTAR